MTQTIQTPRKYPYCINPGFCHTQTDAGKCHKLQPDCSWARWNGEDAKAMKRAVWHPRDFMGRRSRFCTRTPNGKIRRQNMREGA